MRKHNQGFTLIELMISLVILGLVSTVMISLTKQSTSLWQRANTERQHEANRMVVAALKSMASDTGVLPAPVNHSPYLSAPYNPTDATQREREAFLGQGLSNTLINTDGTPSENRRVYQRVSGLTRYVPMSGVSGEKVTLTYDVGVVYATNCPLTKDDCVSKGGIPGDSDKLTRSTVDTWEPKGEDIRPVWVSTFPLQRNLLSETMNRINTLINKEREYYQQKVLAAGAGSSGNVHMKPNGTTANGTTAYDSGCYGGWYNLKAASVNGLTKLGLTSKYGETAWGHGIQYCQDYDPIGDGANEAPYNAAIRFKKNVSTGAGSGVNSYIVISY